jgi:hypothetical protein
MPPLKNIRARKIATPSRRTKTRDLPDVVPPRSVFRLIRSDAKTPNWKEDIGREFRIGYYGRQDGLDVIWLVDDRGKYEQSTDREFLVKYFELVKLSNETDLFGTRKSRLRPLRKS